MPKVAVKTAVKTAAKGLKAPDALFQLFGGGGGGAGGHDARPSRYAPGVNEAPWSAIAPWWSATRAASASTPSSCVPWLARLPALWPHRCSDTSTARALLRQVPTLSSSCPQTSARLRPQLRCACCRSRRPHRRRRPQGNGWARARTSDDAEGGDGSDVDLLQDDDPSLADTAALLLPQDNQMQPLSDARSSNAASGGAGSAGAAGAAGSGRVPGLRSLPDLEEGGGGGGAALRGVASAGSLTARGRLEGNGVGGAARARGPGRGGGKGGSSMRRPLLADEPDGGGVWSSTAGPTPGGLLG